MFARTHKSAGAGPTLDLLRCAAVGNPPGVRTQHLQDWRHPTQQVGRTYEKWCAANWRDRHHPYLSFLNALRREERAAQQVELDAGVLETTKGDQP